MIVVGSAVAELTAQHIISDEVTEKLPRLGAASVTEAGSWALWDLTRGRIPRLDISTDDAVVGPLPQVAVNAQLDDVVFSGTLTVKDTHVQVTVPPSSIASALHTAAPSIAVDSVTADPSDGTVVAAIGPGGLGQLKLKPDLKGGRVTVSVVSLTAMGMDVPLSSIPQLGADLTTQSARQHYPLGLTAKSVQVDDAGVQVDLSGGPSELKGR